MMTVGTGFDDDKYDVFRPKFKIGSVKSSLIDLEAEIANKRQAGLCL